MITIETKVIGESIQLLSSPVVASKSVKSVQILFDFDDAWDGFGRIALFWSVDDEVYTSQIINGVTIVPHEALDETGKIKFGVYGTNGNKRIVTVKMTYKIVEGAYTSVATESVEPSTSLLDQIEAGIGTMEDYAAQMTRVAESTVDIAQTANENSLLAMDKATNAENYAADLVATIDGVKSDVEVLKLRLAERPNSAYVEEGVAYFTSDGQVVFDVTGIGGGGGGGGDTSNRHIEMHNTSGWMNSTLAYKENVEEMSLPISFTWLSTEDEMSTGNGSLLVSVNSVVRLSKEIPQGPGSVDVGPYLSKGSNAIKLTVVDLNNKTASINVIANAIDLSLASPFDYTKIYNSAFSFPYIPTGSVQKVVHFIVDGTEIGTYTTSISGSQQSYTIPKQSHGAHTLRVYFEAVINGQTVRSNELYYEFVSVDPMSNDPIVVSSFNKTEVQQYETLLIDYMVYDPTQLEAPVTIYVNDVEVTSLTVNRETKTYSYRTDVAGTCKISIVSGTASKTFNLTVEESEIHPEAVTDQLALHLTAAGRSNSESNPAVWESNVGGNKIEATFTNVAFQRDGWVVDEDGNTALCIMPGGSVFIPFYLFNTDFIGSGKCFGIEYAVRDVMDYDATVISCMDSGRGFEVNADNAVLASTRGNIDCRFGINTHMRLTFDVRPLNDQRLMYLFIDGEIQAVKQYSGSTGSFAQPTPAGITIGSQYATVYLYGARAYNRYLTDDEVLGNFIADRQDVAEMLRLYRENDIKDDYGNITIAKLTAAKPGLSYGIFEGPESPQYKGDKKTVIFDFWDKASNVQRYLHAEGLKINVQGTSSQYYAVKNYKITLPDGTTVNGVLVVGFNIHDGEIIVIEFTLKADVASSESANNICAAKLYNDLAKELGILTPPQKVNSAVRVGIDGMPCVFFWNYGDGPEFVGKYNFNNDKGTFDSFGFTEGDEAWDVRSNTSELSAYRTNVFQDNWYTEDYEAIYPEDYADNSRLKPMTDWMYSTYQDEATDEDLEEAVTYDGVEYTKDSAAYRLAKYKAELGNWWNIENLTLYFCIIEYFLGADSLQKNMHIVYWHDTGKWEVIPWDLDTILGTDNRGALSFEYWMEMSDRVTDGWVFNGARNVLWMNFVQAFPDRIASMMQRMFSVAWFRADKILEYFKNWQSAWPKALRNADTFFKCIRPYENDGTTTYLPMGLGSKEWQRGNFLPWRERYLASKYDIHVALQSLMFRPYYSMTDEQIAAGAGDLTVHLYKHCYVTAMFDDRKVGPVRVIDGDTVVVHNPLKYANDAVCALHSAAMIAGVDGLENLNVGYYDATYAVNQQWVVLGSNKAGYTNTATKTVNIGTNRMMRLVDLRNCVNFGTDTQKTLDVSGCPNIQKVYLDGTKVQGVELPNGGVLDELHLPATTTAIVLRNHPKLTDANLVVEGYTNVDQLWLEGMTGLDTLELLKKVPASTAIRITGFYWEAEDAEEIEEIFDLFDTMRGIDINGHGQGEEVAKAQLSGTIHTNALRGDEIAAWKERYPTVTVTADHTSSTLTLKSWDGNTTIKTIACVDGVPSESIPTPPSRTSTAQYSYTAVGWNRNQDSQTADSSCVTNVTEDRTVYAAYSRTTRTYTVTWKNSNGTVLETDNNVPYGTIPTYNGSTPQNPTSGGGSFQGWTPSISAVTGDVTYTASYIPTYTATFVLAAEDGGTTLKTQTNIPKGTTPTPPSETPVSSRGSDYTFAGWSPALSGIQANTTYTAVFDAPPKGTITDTWEQIIAAGNDGSYASKYNIGDTKDLNLGTEGTVLMVLVAKNVDSLASGSGKAPMTWISQELLKTTHRWNPSKQDGVEGTGTLGGWEKSEIRSYMKETIKPLIPAVVRNAIKEVTKYSRIYNASGTAVDNVATTDDVWIPSTREVGWTWYESNSPTYSGVFTDNASRIKKNVSSGSAAVWWLRSAAYINTAYTVGSSGDVNNYSVTNSYGVALGFCL